MFAKIKTFLAEAFLEMKKVNWPTRQEATKYTLIVIGISAGTAVFLGGMDYLLENLLSKIIR